MRINPKTNPHGRTRLLGNGGKAMPPRDATPGRPGDPAGEMPRVDSQEKAGAASAPKPDPRGPKPPAAQNRAVARPAGIPASYGRFREEQIEKWRRECLKRRGVDPDDRDNARWSEGKDRITG